MPAMANPSGLTKATWVASIRLFGTTIGHGESVKSMTSLLLVPSASTTNMPSVVEYLICVASDDGWMETPPGSQVSDASTIWTCSRLLDIDCEQSLGASVDEP